MGAADQRSLSRRCDSSSCLGRFFFSSRRRHTRLVSDWSSDVCSSDLSGWAAAGIGFSLDNPMLIVAGSLVGSSGAILSYIMCRAMNRSFISVILGGFGGETAVAAGDAQKKPVKSGSPDDAAFLLSNADTVIIVPGYRLAVARAPHPVKEMATKLQ